MSLVIAFGKTQLKMELGLLSKKEPKLKDLENSLPAPITRKEEVCWRECTQGVEG